MSDKRFLTTLFRNDEVGFIVITAAPRRREGRELAQDWAAVNAPRTSIACLGTWFDIETEDLDPGFARIARVVVTPIALAFNKKAVEAALREHWKQTTQDNLWVRRSHPPAATETNG